MKRPLLIRCAFLVALVFLVIEIIVGLVNLQIANVVFATAVLLFGLLLAIKKPHDATHDTWPFGE